MPATRVYTAMGRARGVRAPGRVVGDKDPLSDLSDLVEGSRCKATMSLTSSPHFATLEIINIQSRRFGEIDDALAAEEGCRDADELKQTLLQFYPNLNVSSRLRVYYFKLI